MISLFDVVDVRSAAIKEFNNMPARCRMHGMNSDLTDEEKRVLAFMEATVSLINRKLAQGVKLEDLRFEVWTHTQEVVEGM
jgi:hypothetical protein